MNQCSDTVWQLAQEIMDTNKRRDETFDAVNEKLAMFTHNPTADGDALPDGACGAASLRASTVRAACGCAHGATHGKRPCTHTHTPCHTPTPATGPLGPRPGAPDASVALAAEPSILVPNEVPGQDPEGGSEVNYGDGDESSSVSGTPRESDSRRTSDFSLQFTMDGGRLSSADGGLAPGGAASGGGGGAMNGGRGGAHAPAAPTTPPTALGAGAQPRRVPPPSSGVGAPPEADGLGGSWQDLVTLRQQSVAARSNPLQHFSDVSGQRHACGARPPRCARRAPAADPAALPPLCRCAASMPCTHAHTTATAC
jgi:hypothetical protein